MGPWYPRARKESSREGRYFLRAPAPPPVAGAQRVRAAAERALADRAGRPARLRLRVVRRAPFPRGVLALLGARGLPGRGEPAHETDPARPRDHPAPDQPSDPRRRAR